MNLEEGKKLKKVKMHQSNVCGHETLRDRKRVPKKSIPNLFNKIKTFKGN